jgi:hypothetical protein
MITPSELSSVPKAIRKEFAKGNVSESTIQAYLLSSKYHDNVEETTAAMVSKNLAIAEEAIYTDKFWNSVYDYFEERLTNQCIDIFQHIDIYSMYTEDHKAIPFKPMFVDRKAPVGYLFNNLTFGPDEMDTALSECVESFDNIVDFSASYLKHNCPDLNLGISDIHSICLELCEQEPFVTKFSDEIITPITQELTALSVEEFCIIHSDVLGEFLTLINLAETSRVDAERLLGDLLKIPGYKYLTLCFANGGAIQIEIFDSTPFGGTLNMLEASLAQLCLYGGSLQVRQYTTETNENGIPKMKVYAASAHEGYEWLPEERIFEANMMDGDGTILESEPNVEYCAYTFK